VEFHVAVGVVGRGIHSRFDLQGQGVVRSVQVPVCGVSDGAFGLEVDLGRGGRRLESRFDVGDQVGVREGPPDPVVELGDLLEFV